MAHQTVSYSVPALTSVDAAASSGVDCAESGSSCPVEGALALLRGRWTALVIGQFVAGDRSFSELAEALPQVSDKILAQRLAQLTEAGILVRQRTPGWPPRVRYALTERGNALLPALHALLVWSRAS